MRWLEAETLEKDAVNIPSTLAFFALRAQFESLLLKITNETELILEDTSLVVSLCNRLDLQLKSTKSRTLGKWTPNT
jgi:hypothetical protein